MNFPKLQKIEFKHIVGLSTLYFAMFIITIVIMGKVENKDVAVGVVSSMITLVITYSNFFWGSSDGSKKKDDALIESSKPKPIEPA